MLKIIERVLIALLALSLILFGLGFFRTRILRDNAGPEIEMDRESITVSVEDGEEALLQGIRAVDAKDGDVSDSLVLQGLSNFAGAGRRQATVAAFDQDNNVAKATREIVYSDYVPPRFVLNQPLNFPAGMQESELIKAVHVEDCLDGDLSGMVSVEMENADAWLDTSVAGETRIVYRVVNSAGDVAELPVTIQIYDSAAYQRALKVVLSQYVVYLEKGAAFDPWQMVTGLERNGEELPAYSDLVDITNPVDTSKSGVYEVTYTTRGDGGDGAKVRLLVVVE
jgi:hypothetical protein